MAFGLGRITDRTENTEQVEAMGGEDGDIYAGEKLGNSLLGFHGIEYILFEDGSPKSVSKISDLHLTYAVAVAGDLRNRCWQLELSWRGESAVNADRVAKVANELELPYTVNSGEYSYGENMLNAGKQVVHTPAGHWPCKLSLTAARLSQMK